VVEKWDYKVVSINDSLDRLDEILRDLGNDGFDLVGVVPIAHQARDAIRRASDRDTGFPQRACDPARMPAAGPPTMLSSVEKLAYAMYWRDELDGARCAGRIMLRHDHAELLGNETSGCRVSRVLPFDEISSARYAHGRLSVRRRNGSEIEIGSVDEPGALKELSDKLQAVVVSVSRPKTAHEPQ